MEKKYASSVQAQLGGAWDYEKAGWVNRLRLFLDSKDFDIYYL